MNTVNSCLNASTRAHSSRLFLLRPEGEQVAYGEFEQRLSRVAALLQSQGVQRGDCVSLIASNSIDLAVMLYGVIAYGAVANPLSPQLSAFEIQNVLKHAAPKAIFFDPDTLASPVPDGAFPISAYRETSNRAPLASVTTPDTHALLMHTSGTTSTPKGILLTHGNLVANTRAAIGRLHLGPQHRTACLLPLYHMFAIISDLSAMAFSGGSTVILDSFQLDRLAQIESAINTYEVNSFSAAPMMFELMLRFGCRLRTGHLRFCVSGAAPLKDSTIAEFLTQYGVQIVPAYGLTETTCFATLSPPDRIKSGSCGIPAGVVMRVVGEEDNALPDGEIGEIQVSGPSVMPGVYLNGPADCFQYDGQRWFRTGDLGYRDSEGYFYITGRKKNMVIRGGEKVFLEDLDFCLQNIPGVEDSATVRLDLNGEERIASIVVLQPGSALTAREIEILLAQRLGRAKSPDMVLFDSAIPRSPTNKVRIRELEQRALNSLVAAR